MLENQLSLDPWKLLTMVCSCANLDISEVVSKYAMMKREEVLAQHPYAIAQYKDGRWKTYICDPSNPNGRKQIARKSKEELEEEIFKHYRGLETKEKKESDNPMLQEFFETWMIWKRDVYKAENKTLTEYRNDWKKFALSNEISKVRIRDVDPVRMRNYFLDITQKHAISKQRLTNIKGVFNNMFRYAVEKEIISSNPLNDIHTSDFVSRCKPAESNKDNYTVKERRLIIDYLKDSDNIYDLAIALDFHLSVRIGELLAIHKDDIWNQAIYIHRSVRRSQNLNDDLSTGPILYSIENRTKGNLETGLRDIPLSEEGMEIVNRILEVNPEGELLFAKNGTMLLADSFNERLRKVCKDLGIKYRSSHQIRFTVATILHESGVPVNQISVLLGHSEIRTTFRYLRQRKPDSTSIGIMESALSK